MLAGPVTAIDSFKLFVIPAAALATFSLLLTIVSLLVPLTVFVFPRAFLTAADAPHRHRRLRRRSLGTSGRSGPGIPG